MAGKCFEQVDGCTFVGKVCEERPSAAVTAGTINARSLVDLGQCLAETVG